MSFKDKRRQRALTKSYNAASELIEKLTALHEAEGSQFQFTVYESPYDTSVHINTNVPENPKNFETADEKYKSGNVAANVDRYGSVEVLDGMKYSPGYIFGPSIGVDIPNAPVTGSGPVITDKAVAYIKTRAKANKLTR